MSRAVFTPSPTIRPYDFNMTEFWPSLETGQALSQIICSPGSPPTKNVINRYVRNATSNGFPAYLLHQYDASGVQLNSWFIRVSPSGVFEYGDDFYTAGVFSQRVIFPTNTLIWGGKQRVGDLDFRACDIIAASSINVGADIYGRSFCEFQEHIFDFEDVLGNVWPEAVKVYNYQELPRTGHGSPVGHHNVFWFAKDDQGRGCGHVQIDYRGNNNVSIRVDAIDQNRWGAATDPLPS